MSATGDHQPVEERIPHCQRLVMKGAMHCVKRYFLSQPIERSHNMLNSIAQIVINNHNERAANLLLTILATAMGQLILPARLWFFFLGLPSFISSVRSLEEHLILAGHGDSLPYHSMDRVLQSV